MIKFIICMEIKQNIKIHSLLIDLCLQFGKGLHYNGVYYAPEFSYFTY